MRFTANTQARLRRSLSIRSLGRNEARLFSDAAAGAAAVAAFSFFFVAGFSPTRSNLSLAGLPLFALSLNAVFRIYAGMRTARSAKGAPLLLSTVCPRLCKLFPGGEAAPVVLWGLIAAPPMTLARQILL